MLRALHIYIYIYIYIYPIILLRVISYGIGCRSVRPTAGDPPEGDASDGKLFVVLLCFCVFLEKLASTIAKETLLKETTPTTLTTSTTAKGLAPPLAGRAGTVGFHNFNLRILNLRVSNPNKLIVDVFLTRCRISMCQGLGPRQHDEIRMRGPFSTLGISQPNVPKDCPSFLLT